MAASKSFQLDTIDPKSPGARSVGLARQVMAAELVTKGDGPERGVRCVVLQNDILSIEVIVDRGLDIGAARVRQMPVSWHSPTGIVAPWLLEQRGSEFLRGFYGGLLTTCGLDHIGHPTDRSADRFGYDHRLTEHLPMHGRIGAVPARLSGYGVEETEHGLAAYVVGTVTQVAVFGEHLVLSRRINIAYGSNRVEVSDRVTNCGYATSPLAVMYHVNLGWPVTSPGAVVEVAGVRVQGDAIGHEIAPPVQGSKQKVCIYSVTPDASGQGAASIVNRRVDEHHSAGVRLRWNASALPSMVRWQIANTAGHYVVGLEPSTMQITSASPDPVFPSLEPGDSRALGVAIELERDAAGEARA
jgi:hypothetical protein